MTHRPINCQSLLGLVLNMSSARYARCFFYTSCMCRTITALRGLSARHLSRPHLKNNACKHSLASLGMICSTG